MELSRRSFISGFAAAGAVAAAGLAGCSPKSGKTESAANADTNAAEAVKHDPKGTESCDLVVVGSGTAGMCAAVRAAQLGANVILLEKNVLVGGSSGYAEGIGAVNSYMHDKAGLSFDDNEVFLRTQEYHHWSADSAVLRRFIENSGATINWLHDDCGVDFYTATVTAPTSYPSWHLGADENGNVTRISESTIKVLQKRCEELGVDLRTESPATGLMTADDGSVCGVYFQKGKDEYAIEAKNVILATGGYSNNQEMWEEFTKLDFDRVWNWGAAGRDGDGIRWAREIGADLHIPSNLMFGSIRCAGADEFEDHAGWVFSWEPALRVNQDGARFMNESLAADFSRGGNAIIAQTKAFVILDKAYLDKMTDEALPVGLESVGIITGEPLTDARDLVEAAVQKGDVFKADTIEDLAKQMGIDPDALSKTVEEFNACCAAGVDEKFGATSEALVPVSTAPFYASVAQPTVFTSVGGLRVDEWLRVLDTDGQPIKGLFAVGTDASSYTGRDYDVGIMSGAEQGWCATGGRLAAEYIASGKAE